MSLEGQVVLVTGAGRGIGRGIAEAVAEAGADMALGDVEDSMSETAALVERAGRRALPLRVDVTDAASLDAAVARDGEGAGDVSTAGSTTRVRFAWTRPSTCATPTGTCRCG